MSMAKIYFLTGLGIFGICILSLILMWRPKR